MKSGDVIYVNKSLIAVSASSRGMKQLRMPEDRHITDIFTGEKLFKGESGYMEFFMKRHEVRLFWRESVSTGR